MLLMRLSAVFLVLQLSGAAHFMLDTFATNVHPDRCETGCEDDAQGQCPPGCLTCHCVHANSSPLSRTVEMVTAIITMQALVVLSVSDEAPSPTQASVYRPPRV